MRILHIAPFNTAGVPYTLVKAERSIGHESRLITLARHPFKYPEDICLELPFINTSGLTVLKKILRRNISAPQERFNIPRFVESSRFEAFLYRLRDSLWSSRIKKLEKILDFDSFDLIIFDGGMSLFRDGRMVDKWRREDIVCASLYLGSDLRVRGVFRHIHEACSCNFTVEYDHLDLYPGIHQIPFPFDFTLIHKNNYVGNPPVRIGHAPSVRKQKGTEFILETLKELQDAHNIEIVLIENKPYEEALKLKRTCSLFIDQISSIGYGVNAVESMAMGIPTFSSLTGYFKKKYPGHPFIEIDTGNLREALIPYIEDSEMRIMKGRESREWVTRVHDASTVVRQIHQVIAEKAPELRKKLL